MPLVSHSKVPDQLRQPIITDQSPVCGLLIFPAINVLWGTMGPMLHVYVQSFDSLTVKLWNITADGESQTPRFTGELDAGGKILCLGLIRLEILGRIYSQ